MARPPRSLPPEVQACGWKRKSRLPLLKRANHVLRVGQDKQLSARSSTSFVFSCGQNSTTDRSVSPGTRETPWNDWNLITQKTWLFDVPDVTRQIMAVGARHRFFLRASEEHTSEPQSRENLVCRLLLEKKK